MSLRTLAATAADASQACASGALALHPACWSADNEQPTLAPAGRACVQLAGKVEWCEHCAREILGQRELSAWLQHANESMVGPRKPLARRLRWIRSMRMKPCFGCESGDIGSCCSRRGECLAGVCICQPGASGLDCAESSPRPPPQPRPAAHPGDARQRSLQVFVYDLPADLGLTSYVLRTWYSPLIHAHAVYTTEWRFIDYLLNDVAVRTHDPEEADLFFVPTLGSLQGMPKAAGAKRCLERGRLQLAVKWLRAHYPYWDRSGGRDHVVFLPGDQGACGLGATACPGRDDSCGLGDDGTRPIYVTAWGLIGSPDKMSKFARRAEFEAADPRQLQAEMAAGHWCHSPHKDVTVPPFGDGQLAAGASPSAATMGGAAAAQRAARGYPPARYALSHVGGIWGAGNHGTRKPSFYSQGMRQALWLRYGNEAGRSAGIFLHNRSLPTRELLRVATESRFCFSPSGHGWGMRTGKNAMLGCVPLVAQPFVVQPYETELDYARFSRRADWEDLPRLPELLNVSNADLAAMRAQLPRVAPAFLWRVEAGGLAYNYTLLSLCHRAVELRGRLRAAGATCQPLAAGLPGGHATRRWPHWYPPALERAARAAVRARRLG